MQERQTEGNRSQISTAAVDCQTRNLLRDRIIECLPITGGTVSHYVKVSMPVKWGQLIFAECIDVDQFLSAIDYRHILPKIFLRMVNFNSRTPSFDIEGRDLWKICFQALNI
jgi:hypothetical protein